MKKISVLTLILLITLTGFNQKVYFVYLQSENQEPFFVRLNDKTYNSSSTGYLILSKLRDSSYTLNVGFPGSQYADQKFSVVVNRKDQGFLIKNMDEKNLGLFNLQTLALIKSDTRTPDIAQSEKVKSNAFTDLLSKAVDDSTLKEKPVMVEEFKKTDTIATVKKEEVQPEINPAKTEKTEELTKPASEEETKKEKPDTVMKKVEPQVVIKDTTAAKPVVTITDSSEVVKKEIQTDTSFKKQEIEPNEIKEPDTLQVSQDKSGTKETEPDVSKTTVTLYSESSTTEGFGLIFLDKNPSGKIDTIRVLIPNQTQKETVPVKTQEEKKFLDIPVADSTGQPGIPGSNNEAQKQNLDKPESVRNGIKNNCTAVAIEDDFYKLRKKMAGESSEELMIAEAKKQFRIKCFTVQQIRNLGALFLSDEGKYKFFDAAYAFVADLENFPSLQSEIKDEYFINRFKAILRQ